MGGSMTIASAKVYRAVCSDAGLPWDRAALGSGRLNEADTGA